jgi:translation initiation factor 1
MPQRTDRGRVMRSTDPALEPEPPVPNLTFPSAHQQTARIAHDRKDRGGKTVTVISGLRHDPATLNALLKTLKQRCGVGGALKDGALEIQGDHRACGCRARGVTR